MADLKSVTAYPAPDTDLRNIYVAEFYRPEYDQRMYQITISNAALRQIYCSDGAEDLWKKRTPVHDTLKRIVAELARREKKAEKPEEPAEERITTESGSKLTTGIKADCVMEDIMAYIEPKREERSSTMKQAHFYNVWNHKPDEDGRPERTTIQQELKYVVIEGSVKDEALWAISQAEPDTPREAIEYLGPFSGNP